MFLIVAFANAGPLSQVSKTILTSPDAAISDDNFIRRLAAAVRDSTRGQSFSAAVKDTSVNGLEGLNIKWSVPFKIQDYTVGFKYSLADLKKVPDSLFAKRSFETTADGVANVETDYNVAEKTLAVAANWASDKLGLSFGANGNSKDRVTEVSASTSHSIRGNRVTLKGTWDRLKSQFDVNTRAVVDDITAEVDYNTADKNPVLSVSYQFDSNNVVTPAVSLKDGEMSYRWNRKINGGALDAKFRPGDSLAVEWQDNGSNGVWSTKAHIPTSNPSGAKVSFSREWNY